MKNEESIKVCFIGLGSIASRHIKNLWILYGEAVTVDILRSGHGSAQIEEDLMQKIHKIYYDIKELPHNYDIIFITNPTRMHYGTLRQACYLGKHFFIEKPVFETGRESLELLRLRKGSIYYAACPLRYTKVMQYLKKEIDFSDVYSVRCVSSSYLPQWRSGCDYRHTYSARKELGGGVSIDLIHEWDYICYLLGPPLTVKSLISRKSNLEIDSDDIAVYIAEYKQLLVEVHLDYFGRVPSRKIEIFSRDDTIEADLLEEKITYRKEKKTVNLAEGRNSYQIRELEHFFQIINGEVENDNTIEQACKVLQIARGD